MEWAMKILAVFVGGGIGCLARSAVSLALNGRGWPHGTLVVNILGCFLIGLFGALAARQGWSGVVQGLLMVGFCGGFTTFSTFSNEALAMLQSGNLVPFIAYVGASIFASISFVAIGWWLGGRI